MGAVTQAARDGSNLVPPIIAAVEARATVGEIADAMRDVFGEFKEAAAL
jgi:methylmalonyl-CoA mutase N-terminal domain/subunit